MDLPAYYSARAPEYDQIFAKPERQPDLASLRDLLLTRLAGSDLLEIACGTGYWTHHLAPAVRSIVALDINESVLEIARSRPLPPGKVRFLKGDAYAIPLLEGSFNAGLAAFWWSHVPKNRLHDFLSGFLSRLVPGAVVIFLDNNFVAGSSTPISRVDPQGNSWQLRRLRDGATAEVLKNFPAAEELRRWLAPFDPNPEIHQFAYYWCAVVRVAASIPRPAF